MLNLTIAMFKRCLFSLFFLVIFCLPPLTARAAGQPRLDAPRQGDVLQGQVPINGNTDLPDAQSYEVAFGYENAAVETWFLIHQSDQPVKNGQLAVWDTNAIRDGDYRLKVSVRFTTGETSEVVVGKLKVRNYSQIGIEPAGAVESEATTQPTPSLAATERPTPTALPPNPLAVNREMIRASMAAGAAAAVLILSGLGILLGLRRFRRRG